MEAKLGSNCSYSWRSMLWGRELLKKGLLWKVGNGEDIRAFQDAWLPDLPEGRLIQRTEGLQEWRVAAFLSDQGEWETNLLRGNCLPVEVDQILSLGKPNCHVRDRRYWKFDPKGEYSVKSGYLVATNYYDVSEKSSVNNIDKWWRFVWSFQLPQRIKIFAWRAFHNIIPTELNLHRHHVPVFGKCGWCNKGWGSTEHVIIYCEKVRAWWKAFGFWPILKRWEGWGMGEIGRAMQNGTSREEFAQWLVGLWLIWKVLCAEKHKDQKKLWTDLQNECKTYIDSYIAAREQAATEDRVLPREGSDKWVKPRRGRFRLDVDYGVDDSRRQGGVGAILRDEKGEIVFALAKPVAESITVLHGELTAIVVGIRQCVEEEISPVEVYTDSMLAVLAIAEERESESILYEDMFDFFALVKNLNVLSINHVRRRANSVAHELAQIAKQSESTLLWHDSWPSWLLRLVSVDY